MQVRLYRKDDCPLCDELKADLLALQQEIGFVVEERNIEADPVAWDRYRYLIPVLDIEGGPLLYPPHDFLAIRRALLNARDGNQETTV